MIIEFDLDGSLTGTPDTILSYGNSRVQADNIRYFEGPDDYSKTKYDYVPQQSGVYDPNGFVLKEQPSETDEKLNELINAGFTEAQAQVILQITNS
jgi:hypothetical protein